MEGMKGTVEIYGRTGCAACDKAVRFCDSVGFDYVYKSLGKDYSITEMYEIAPQNHKTFPMIAVGGKYLGTYEDLVKYNETQRE